MAGWGWGVELVMMVIVLRPQTPFLSVTLYLRLYLAPSNIFTQGLRFNVNTLPADLGPFGPGVDTLEEVLIHQVLKQLRRC